MVVSLLKVLHTGIQDSRLLPLKGNPNVEMFSKVFIRTGRFTTQWVRLDFDTRPQFGGKSVITIPNKGHLVGRLFLVTTMPDIDAAQAAGYNYAQANNMTFAGPLFSWTNSLGHAVVEGASIDIGGSRVEKLDARLLEVLDEFYTPLEKVELVNKLIKRNMTNFPQYTAGLTGVAKPPVVTYTPLPFWFSRGDPGVSLPVDALSVDKVKLTIQFAPLNNLYVSDSLIVSGGAGDAQQCQSNSVFFPLNSPQYVLDPSGTRVPGLGGTQTGLVVSPVPGYKAPETYTIGDTYLMAEYIYLDAPEANKFRISDIEVPVVQHYSFEPFDTKFSSRATIPLKIPNPTRNLFFFAQRYEAPSYNAPFLATRDLSGSDGQVAPWWPNAESIPTTSPGELVPGYLFRNSEPFSSIQLTYEGHLIRYSTTCPAMFRSYYPSSEMKKSPFVNRYYYSLHFGLNHGLLPPSQPCGEANLDKIVNIKLEFEFKPFRGTLNPNAVPRYRIHVWAETYNIFRVYGGRGGMLFAY